MTYFYTDAPLIGPEMIDGRYRYTFGEVVKPEPEKPTDRFPDMSAMPVLIDNGQTEPLPPVAPDDGLPAWGMKTPWVNPPEKATGLRGVSVKGLYRLVSMRDGKRRPKFAFENLDLDDCGTVLEMTEGSRVLDLLVDRVRMRRARAGATLFQTMGLPADPVRGLVSDLDIEYVDTPVNLPGDAPNAFHAGFKNDNAERRIEYMRYERNQIKGPLNVTDGFDNADCIAAEPEVNLLDLIDCDLFRASDAAIDSKAKLTRLMRVRLADARTPGKFWHNVWGKHVTIEQPKVAHVMLAGSGQRKPMLIGENWRGLGQAPMFRIENGPFEIHATGSYEGKQLVQLAGGGVLMPGSTWNGSEIG